MSTETTREPTQVTRPERSRTCVGCHGRVAVVEWASLLRVVLGPKISESDRGAGKHGVAVDVAGSAFGRGAHVHADRECLAKACQGGLSRAFRREVVVDVAVLATEVVRGMDRRVEGLLLGARRAGMLAFGDDARRLVQNGAPLVLVAHDAGASAIRLAANAVTEGRAVVWGTKATLGALFARSEVALVAICHHAVAHEIRRAKQVADRVGIVSV